MHHQGNIRHIAVKNSCVCKIFMHYNNSRKVISYMHVKPNWDIRSPLKILGRKNEKRGFILSSVTVSLTSPTSVDTRHKYLSP